MKNIDKELNQAIIEWDIQNWSKTLVYWAPVIETVNKTNAKVLCLGERNGGLSLWFALQGFKVICSDYGGPREEARRLHLKYGVSDLVEYEDLNIFSLPYASDTFEIVACKSVIGGLKLDYKDRNTRTLDNQKLAVDEVRRVLRPGGFFLGAENMKGSWMHRLGRELLKGKKIGWRHFRMKELKWLLQDFTHLDILFHGFLGTYYPIGGLNTVFDKADSLFSRFLPDDMLYIGFIRAIK